MPVNKHGLSRYIPSDIRRTVRRDAGFGCILCGKVLCDYDHFDPDYADAKEHNPTKIVLLCVEHHRLKTLGSLDKQYIAEGKKHPYCLANRPYQQNLLLMRSKAVTVKCLTNIFRGYFAIDFIGERILEVKPDPLGLQPFYLSAKLFNRLGENVFSINHSDVLFNDPTWDVQVSGSHFIFHSADRKIDLDVEVNENPEEVELKINRLHTYLKGQTLLIENNELRYISGETNRLTIRYCEFLNCGINLGPQQIGIGSPWQPKL